MGKVEQVCLTPIGKVHADFHETNKVPITGGQAFVEIFPEYLPALQRIEENSHLWLLMWFHEADRDLLRTVPGRVNKNLPEYGVFALRAYKRPNPIGLTLVSLKEVVENGLIVEGLDAIDGTPVLDIKPYYEQDIVFSPRTSYIRAADYEMRRTLFFNEALAHHQEICPFLYLAVRMALVADELMGQITKEDLNVTVRGSRCLGDTLQGLTHARLANPPRFTFIESNEVQQSTWKNRERSLTISARRYDLDEHAFLHLTDDQLFELGE
ncbi:MAG: tRNA (N6-threonylcarbamoyladenosine(37)-N6)-methyltransferase TrmO [Dethiobacteria bacterium]|nr:tRNA (N6-threonylcarbamoyladenosine(37)-N6)-methyltransferase TrmO [Bacillota bacterium]